MHPDVDRILFSEERLRERITELGATIAKDFNDKNPLVLVVLRGSYMFAAVRSFVLILFDATLT